jgi:hypothetical protein
MERNDPSNKDKQAVYKAPGEEKGKQQQVTTNDLKGKKVDRDIAEKKDDPMQQRGSK